MFTPVDWGIFLWLSLTYSVSFSGFMVMAFANWKDWYIDLKKAPFSPPNWVFAPAWFTLYTLRGVASYIVWRSPEKAPSLGAYHTAVAFALISLIINALWTPIFFGWRLIRLGLLVLIFAFISMVMTTGLFFSIDITAGILSIPELLWLVFAFSLNVYIVCCNEMEITRDGKSSDIVSLDEK